MVKQNHIIIILLLFFFFCIFVSDNFCNGSIMIISSIWKGFLGVWFVFGDIVCLISFVYPVALGIFIEW